MSQDDNQVKRRFELVEKEPGKIELVLNDSDKQVEEKAEVDPMVSEFLDNFILELNRERHGFTPIHVDEIASKLAVLYERIRKIIDWKDDNALRRSAAERILKRVLFPRITGFLPAAISAEELSETVTVELIRGGHLPNDKVPRERIDQVAISLKKYLYFLNQTLPQSRLDVKLKFNFSTFIIELAACEIEEILTHPMKEYGLIMTMTNLLDTRIRIIPADTLSQEEKIKNIFIAVCRTLYDLDDNFITYRLLRNKYSFWRNPQPEEMQLLGQNLLNDWRAIQYELDSKTVKKFVAVAETIDTVFVLLDDILENLISHPSKIKEYFEYKSKFLELITVAYEKRYKTLKNRLFRLGAFSTLSVFLSNWVTFFIVEVPLARLFYEGFNTWAAVADFAIPTAIMFALVSIIRAPRKDNLGRVIKAALSFVYPDEAHEDFRIRLSDRTSIFRLVLGIIYVVSILLVFYGVAWIFYTVRLPITSVIFDTFTIALTIYAAQNIKNKARELNVNEHTSLFDFLLDVVTLPIAKVGSFFAAKWKEYNIVSILFNFLIETPFSLILDFIQEWSEFLKERRQELH